MQLHTLIFFSGEGAKEEDAYVLDVETAETSEPSFTVMVPRYGIEGRVNLSDISPTDPDLKRDADKHCMTYKGASIQVFDKVRIKLFVRELEDHQRELVIELLEPKLSERDGEERSAKRIRAS